MQQQLANYNGTNFQFQVNSGTIEVNLKEVLKHCFKYGGTMTTNFKTNHPTISVNDCGSHKPMWISITDMATVLQHHESAACANEQSKSFDITELNDVICDMLFQQGQTTFKSRSRIQAEAKAAKDAADAEMFAKLQAAEAEKNEMAEMRRQLQELKDADLTRTANEAKAKAEAEAQAAKELAEKESERFRLLEIENKQMADKLQEVERIEAARLDVDKLRQKANVNPVIKALNDAWFPVIVSFVFCVLIGQFSYEILSETMGMNPLMNGMLATVYALFPVLTAIRRFEFKIFGKSIQPLWIVMLIDMVFTAYHVGWLRVGDFEHTVEMHWLLKVVYIVFIPTMQKSTNTMILDLRKSYLSKGLLPNID